MGRQCTVCAHPKLDEINKLLICSDSYRDIARQFNVSKDALARHKESHIPELLLKSWDAKEALQADNLLDQIVYYESEARRFKEEAESQGDIELALKAVDRALKCVEIFAKVRGLIQEQPQINIVLLPEWVELRTRIVTALRPHPEALEAVRNAIQ